MLSTPRLRLVTGSVPITKAEIEDRRLFGELIGAAVPANWPPETLADALTWFLEQLESAQGFTPWFIWYALLEEEERKTLVGSLGFKGPPDRAETVEVGYSMLPQYQGRGIATEMVGALVEWALRQDGVSRVIAETTPDNAQSLAVLRKIGFTGTGPGLEPGSLRFERS